MIEKYKTTINNAMIATLITNDAKIKTIFNIPKINSIYPTSLFCAICVTFVESCETLCFFRA